MYGLLTHAPLPPLSCPLLASPIQTYAVDSFLSFLLFTAFIFAVIETNTITGGQSTIMMQVAPYRFQYGFGLVRIVNGFLDAILAVSLRSDYLNIT